MVLNGRNLLVALDDNKSTHLGGSPKSERLKSLMNQILLLISVIFALTGFACTYKIQAEEECLSSNVLCYECDSRYDPNCADPFELPSISLTDQQALLAAQSNDSATSFVYGRLAVMNDDNRQQQKTPVGAAGNNSSLRPRKEYPNTTVCHGCCVKITSKTPEGATYVKRTCTTNLQINYFMVGLVCMKESGDRGKMCFCETDHCNGTVPTSSISTLLIVVTLLIGCIMSHLAFYKHHVAYGRSITH